MSIKAEQFNFLEGGGTIGAHIRTKDWTTTSLGAPETWPESLKIMVRTMLDHPFGMCIAWGPSYTQIYNTGYLQLLDRTKYPDALGRSIRDTLAEVWDLIGTLLDKAMKGEAARFSDFLLPLNPNGDVESCYFDLAFSPIKLVSGAVGGVLITIVDVPRKRQVEDEQKAHENELEFVLEASKLATYDYNPLTNRFTCNSRLKVWFGLPDKAELTLSDALNAVAKNDKERVSSAIKDVLEYRLGGNYDIEYAIINPLTSKETIVHARGRTWFNDHQVAYRLTGTLEDVTDRVVARKKIEESERNLRLMILQAPVAISIFRDSDYKVEIANKYALELWGKTAAEVLNISIFDAMPELISQGIKELLDAVSETGRRYATSEHPLQIKRKGILETIYINFSYEALYDSELNINGVMAIGYDVTSQVLARKKVEESEQNMRALVDSAPFPIGVFTGKEMRITLANQSIMDVWGKGNDVVGELFTNILPEVDNLPVFEQVQEVLRTGEPFHAKNEYADILTNGVLKRGYFNYSFTPIVDADGQVHSVMNTAADVTELNEAKQKVEESEKRFRSSVMQAPLGIVVFRGPENVIEMANASYLQIVDKTETEFVGKPLFESLPEVEESIAPIIAAIYDTGNDFYGYEFPIGLTRKGKTKVSYFNFVYHPLKENNVITGIMVVATEVTATVKAKHLIEENEEKLKLVIEASELGIWDLNLRTQAMEASDRCYDILGFSNGNALTQERLISFVHPDDVDLREKAFEKAFISGVLHYQVRIIGEDQVLRWKDVKGKVFYDADNVPERMLGTVRDITEERNFHQQLLDREEKFRLLADSMPQFIWTSGPEGHLNYFNQSVFDFSGLTLEQIKKDGWLQMIHPDDSAENIRVWNETINLGKDFLLEHRFRKHDGEYRWQLSRAIPQKDADGVIKMWVGTSTDIQEQKESTTKLENMVQQRTNELQQKNVDLEKMNKELQSFVYISSHDLQEPLRKIQTFASRIKEKELDQLSDSARNYFSRMQVSASRMQNLIQDLIAYSRTNAQVSTFDIYSLEAIIDDAKETLSEELEGKEVYFELENICNVKIIVVQFQQVILNLISNSIKFAKADVPVHIKISCETLKGVATGIAALKPQRTYCHICFSDNGIGFEQHYNERIFEVFQRLHSREDYSGTGIGLAIVKRIIENHEGFISAKSKMGEGAVFDIYIPAP
ncbi:PAS domain-containing protein [Winogradskyella sp. PAMC22761]|nr:PAS domain-containing protein [Winogradskyella sp. PAMC22761]